MGTGPFQHDVASVRRQERVEKDEGASRTQHRQHPDHRVDVGFDLHRHGSARIGGGDDRAREVVDPGGGVGERDRLLGGLECDGLATYRGDGSPAGRGGVGGVDARKVGDDRGAGGSHPGFGRVMAVHVLKLPRSGKRRRSWTGQANSSPGNGATPRGTRPLLRSRQLAWQTYP